MGQTLPIAACPILSIIWSRHAAEVSQPDQGRQGASLLEHRGIGALLSRAGRAAPRPISRRTQRLTPEGFPLAYEVLPGNTTDKSTLRDFLKKIENQYGRARRVWVMDRGIPTEEVLLEMRAATESPVQYLVGTPKSRLGQMEAELLKLPLASGP